MYLSCVCELDMFKIIKLNYCPTLQANLNIRYPRHEHETRTCLNPIVPFPRVEAIRISYKYQSIKVWNDIPAEIRNSLSLRAFRKNYTKYLISYY